MAKRAKAGRKRKAGFKRAGTKKAVKELESGMKAKASGRATAKGKRGAGIVKVKVRKVRAGSEGAGGGGGVNVTMSVRLPGNPYSVHPGVAMVQGWIASLKEKTGRTLDEWVDHIRAQQMATEAAVRDWLKQEMGIGSNTAWWLAEKANPEKKPMGISEDDPETYLKAAMVYVEEMFGGAKAALRPMYEELLRLGLSMGPEAKACPCKTMVPLYRNHVFAQIKPTTQTRIDLGLALAAHGDARTGRLPARLIPTGGLEKKDRITHRIEIKSLKDIDGEVREWMKTAYRLDE